MGAIVTTAADPIWIDPSTGYAWSIDANSGEYRSGSDWPLTRWYQDGTCSGPPFLIVSHAPRVPFRLDGTGSLYMVRPDSVGQEEITPQSYGSSGACTFSAWGDPVPAIAEHTRSTSSRCAAGVKPRYCCR